MGCYSCTIQKETNFYQPKQGYPPWMPDHIDFTDKNTKKPLPRDISGPASSGHFSREISREPGTALKRLIIHRTINQSINHLT